MADIEKVIKGLEYCIADEYCDDCPYTDECFELDDEPYGEKLMRDALELIKEQKQVVYCKDCKHYGEQGICPTFSPKADWFCANGERR